MHTHFQSFPYRAIALFIGLFMSLMIVSAAPSNPVIGYQPARGAHAVCVDTHLSIRMVEQPILGTSGKVRLYDAQTDELIDSLDLSLPAGPTASRTYSSECDYLRTPYSYERTSVPTNRTCQPGTPSHGNTDESLQNYQLNIIGGFTDGFHFHPILVRNCEAVIYLHNNVLEYGHTYYVTIDREVFQNKRFKGISRQDGWTFSTRAIPSQQGDTIRVNADGSADFCTVQGALDAVADWQSHTTVIRIAAGDYEEIVYARNKTNLIIEGEGMEATRVHYANNEVFNPHPLLIKTNEWPGTFPSRRAAFMLDNCHDIVIRNMTIATDLKGQAEGLLLNGERIALYDVHIIGSGDALQANGTIYMLHCQIDGGGDTILGRGSVFARFCDFRNDGGPFTWVRNTMGYHGDVFVDCTFSCPDGRLCDYGRTPTNHGSSYPNAEIVLLNCRVRNLNPQGWSAIGEKTSRMLELNTRDMESGQLVDVSKRHPFSRQLSDQKDAELIQCYSNPAYVLRGWNPEADMNYVWQHAEHIAQNIRVPEFAEYSVSIDSYGAVADDSTLLAHTAINQAIEHVHQHGGGTVVIPGKTYYTGPITLLSDVRLHLEDGAVLRFATDIQLYYPAVLTRWEGLDCYNTRPLIYAYGADNIAITGHGTLDAQASRQNWWARQRAIERRPHQVNGEQHPASRLHLLELGEQQVPVEERRFGIEDALRPQFVNLYRCSTVLIEDITIISSPFWVLHPLLCQDLTVRGVTIDNHGPNGDGCDPESCRNVLIEHCTFNTGDDCIAIKSGRNADGRRWNIPSENMVVRHCHMSDGHGGIVVGSEISGGYRHLYVDDCTMSSPNLERVVRIKTSNCRGGLIEHIYVRNVEVGECKEAVLRINLDYEPEEKAMRGFDPIVRNVYLWNVNCHKSKYGTWFCGLNQADHLSNIYLENCHFDGVAQPEGYSRGQIGHLEMRHVYINGIKQ